MNNKQPQVKDIPVVVKPCVPALIDSGSDERNPTGVQRITWDEYDRHMKEGVPLHKRLALVSI